MFAPSERFVEIGYVEDKIVLPNSGSPFSQPVIVNRFFPVKKTRKLLIPKFFILALEFNL